MRNARRPTIALLAAIAMTLATGGAAHAAKQADDDEGVPNARLEGYAAKAQLGGGVAGSFAILALLGAVSIGIMFKNSNRSHLD